MALKMMIETQFLGKLCFGMTNQHSIASTPMAPLMAQIFYPQEPTLDMSRFKDAVVRYCGSHDSASTFDSELGIAHLFMNEGVVEYEEGKSKSQLWLSRAKTLPEMTNFEAALGQTWSWAEARQSLEQCQCMLVATDLRAGPLDRHRRSILFLGFIRAILEAAPATAIHFMNAELLVDPNRFLQEQNGGVSEQMQSLINVRLFQIEGSEGECIMDTMGLSVLGLPDIQCHFQDLDCGTIANKIYSLGLYLFEVGDVIENGHTIPGLSEDEKWRCQHEMALVGPERVVLDLNPRKPFAAGGRKLKTRKSRQ